MKRVTAFVIAACAVCSFVLGQSGSPVTYTDFNGDTLTLYPWKGKKVAILTQSANLNPAVMSSILGALDSAWRVYEQITGSDPEMYPPTTLNGLDIIAEVPGTCGAACSYLGYTGTEIDSTSFNTLYNGVLNSNQFDQALFYEFGRNFWFYDDELGALTPFATGFAVANRFVSMDRTGVKGGPFNGTLPYAQFEQSILTTLLQTYLGDASLNWQNTLAANYVPPTGESWTVDDLAGSMIHRIYADYGMNAYIGFWRALGALPSTSTQNGAIQNFVAAAKTATGADYSFLFNHTPGAAPQIRPAVSGGAAVANAAPLDAGFSPGDLLTISGSGLAFDTLSGAALMDGANNTFATRFDCVAVTVDGFPCRLIFISPSQINCQIAREAPASDSAPVQMTLSGVASNSELIPISSTAPALFGDIVTEAPILSDAQTGELLAGIQIANNRTYLLWGQGLGPLTNAPADGAECPSTTSQAILTVSLEIGGAAAPVKLARCAAGSLIDEIEFTLPATLKASGSTVNATLSVGGKQLQFTLPVTE